MADATAVTALLPLRLGGKSRLGGALDAADRRALVLAMLDDVVAALRGAGITDVRVLAADADAAGAAAVRGLAALEDPAPGGDLRRAVDAGLAAVGDAGLRLVVAADLPGLRPADVSALLTHGDRVTVLPTQDGGTAVLLLPAGVTIPSRHGRGSAAAHAAAALEAGLDARALAPTAASVDLDGPEDLAALDVEAVGQATAATLLRAAERRRG